MDCLEFRNQYLAFVDQTLPPAAQSAADLHLITCSACARHDMAMRRGLVVLRNLPSVQPSADFYLKLTTTLHRMERAEQHASRYRGPGLASFAAAAAGVVGIGFLAAQLPALGGDSSGIVVSGWSAGGHLTSMALSHPKVRAGMAISGIYDLEPIRASYLNVKLGLDEAMSRRNSPMMQAGGAPKPLSLVVGASELPLLRRQTADFAGHRTKYGLPVTYEEIPGANHFTIMDEMVSPQGRITTLIRQLFERTAG